MGTDEFVEESKKVQDGTGVLKKLIFNISEFRDWIGEFADSLFELFQVLVVDFE